MKDFSKHRWQCGTCGKWHTGIPLDVGFTYPDSYLEWTETEKKKVFVNTDVCDLGSHGYYFVRGLIAIPIKEHGEEFRYGPWASLSKRDFQYVVEHWNDPEVESTAPIEGRLDSELKGYPNTVGLKLQIHLKKDTRPFFVLKPAKHPLVQEQREGISLERVQEITSQYGH